MAQDIVRPQGAPAATPPEHYIFDSVISGEELLWLYHSLLNTDGWTLSRTSNSPALPNIPFMSFPGLHIEDRGQSTNQLFSGYFRAIVFRIRDMAKKQYNVHLPPNIFRIHVGAKSSTSRTNFHVDTRDAGVWTILGFLNPIWNAADGGEFFLKDHKITYKSGRFVVFRSNTEHDGGYVVNETLNYWRVSVNIMLDENRTWPYASKSTEGR
ncbi:hypothetical protein [Niveispirillum sp.]|uniref:hypothetical protein n=1 Tax=Niveispirillum sp. TaxID=1917217 RepID=UPI001B6B4C04|nr:hypothetical protein [Niveispirillum sp.]MBP7336172.1 hypothetical protein [Niveispirillum sp.]